MPVKESVFTPNSPAPRPFYSQAVKCNGMVYCSGQLAADPKTNELIGGTIQDRTRLVLKNLSAVLEAAGSSIDNVVKVNVFITNMDNFGAVNEVYEEVFTVDPKPCRTCVAVFQLPRGTDVEIECVAALN
ncbi:hypothetical protein SEPCBS57363_005355 [Sporothrix epigloea]|uniref:Uncharacterized protein n=1 Tax=Sporothrix epigloea TaxID=1892477 RepID=A0ABP0E0Y8_9PEZI